MRLVAALVGAVTALSGGDPARVERTPTVEARQSFDLDVPSPPSLMSTGSETLLVHELHLTNFAPRALTLQRLRVLHSETGLVLLDMKGASLAAAISLAGSPGPGRAEVPPGGRAIIYLEVPVERSPAAVSHLIDYSVDGLPTVPPGTLSGRKVFVDSRPLPVLSPPLRGGPWVAVYDPSLGRGHRRVFYAVGGRARLPGRFAIDWMPAGPPGGGAGESGLGSEVLAVADGVVASTRDGMPEPAPGAPRPRASMAEATGNYVSINIGGERFAFYEHLMPDLRVRPGDRVRRGQVIGRLGSTGQASRPHLHFHVANADSPLGAEGLPYRLQGARTVGAYPSIAAFEAHQPWRQTEAPSAEASFPAPNAIVVFGRPTR
jgi:hypothetical protein